MAHKLPLEYSFKPIQHSAHYDNNNPPSPTAMQINLASSHLQNLSRTLRQKPVLTPQDMHQISLKLTEIKNRLKQTCGQLQISSKSVIDDKGPNPEAINQYTNAQTKNMEQKNAAKVLSVTSNFRILSEMATAMLGSDFCES